MLYRDSKGKLRFCPPMPLDIFMAEARRQLENIFVSIKSKNKVVTRNTNVTKKKSGVNKKVQLTPRGQLHNETIYGSIQRYCTKEEKVGASFNAEKIQSVANNRHREALLKRLNDFGNDPKKAFTGKNSLEKIRYIWMTQTDRSKSRFFILKQYTPYAKPLHLKTSKTQRLLTKSLTSIFGRCYLGTVVKFRHYESIGRLSL